MPTLTEGHPTRARSGLKLLNPATGVYGFDAVMTNARPGATPPYGFAAVMTNARNSPTQAHEITPVMKNARVTGDSNAGPR